MKNNLLLSLHEKAISVLEAYYKAEKRAISHENDTVLLKNNLFYDAAKYQAKRVQTNKAIMARLQAYYGRIIEKINQHKP